jgi:hypothetical protein
MRWMHSVGMVRWRRIHPDLNEILSGGVGLVRWCRFGMWDETWDLLALFWSRSNQSVRTENCYSDLSLETCQRLTYGRGCLPKARTKSISPVNVFPFG